MRRPAGFSLSAVCALHLTTLFTLAVAHPLYDALGQQGHSSFLAAHRVASADIWLLVSLLSVVLPLVVCLLLWSLRILSRTLASGLYLGSIFVLCGVLFAAALTGLLPGPAVAPTALVSAVLATCLYGWIPLTRSFATLMSPIILVSPILFVSGASVGSFLSSPEVTSGGRTITNSDLPSIVMIVFDELPLTSLLDENREIDRVRYPNFAELAGTSSWYRNTTALHYSTWIAIPSLLTGSDFYAYSRRLQLGNLSGKLDRRRLPSSLFSLLEGTHRIIAMESFTDLAPADSAVPEYRPSLSQRFPGLLLDVAILYGHIAVPPPLDARLPALYGGWQDLASAGAATPEGSDWPYLGKKADEVQHFIEVLLPPTQPTFYFVHFSLPHFPFTYNHLGQSHEDGFRIPDARFRKATGEAAWANETVADLAYQAHLLQLGFTDQLLGRMVARLKELQLFDDSLIVITSDHGTSFYWDTDSLASEDLARVQASDTLHVPLIIKEPGQQQGEIVDRPVQLLDVVPTMADLLGVEIPWVVDGISARLEAPEERTTSVYLTHQTRKLEFDSLDVGAKRSLKRKLAVFGAGDLESLYTYGPYKQLVGQPVDAFDSTTSSAKVVLTNPGRYRTIDPTSARLPAYVKGEIQRDFQTAALPQGAVAVAINGVIASTTTTTLAPVDALVRDPGATAQDDRVRYFLARVPPTALASGINVVTVHGIVAGEPGQPPSLIDFSP